MNQVPTNWKPCAVYPLSFWYAGYPLNIYTNDWLWISARLLSERARDFSGHVAAAVTSLMNDSWIGCLQNEDLRPKTQKRRPQKLRCKNEDKFFLQAYQTKASKAGLIYKTKTPLISRQLTTNKAFKWGSSFCSLSRLNSASGEKRWHGFTGFGLIEM